MTHLEVFEQVVHSWFHVQRVEPECEHSSFPLAFRVKVLDRLRCLGLLQWLQPRPGVKQVGDKGQVELRVTRDETVGSKEPTTANLVGILQDLLRSLVEISSLERVARALIRLELVEQYRVVFSIRDVFRKVADLSLPSRSFQVVVEPSKQDLVWRKSQKLLQRLSIVQKTVQFGVDLDVDLAEQTPSDNLPDETENEMFTTFGDILRTNVNDGTSDTFRRSDDNVVVFGHLKGVEWFGFACFD